MKPVARSVSTIRRQRRSFVFVLIRKYPHELVKSLQRRCANVKEPMPMTPHKPNQALILHYIVAWVLVECRWTFLPELSWICHIAHVDIPCLQRVLQYSMKVSFFNMW